jgi:hypothetical protein
MDNDTDDRWTQDPSVKLIAILEYLQNMTIRVVGRFGPFDRLVHMGIEDFPGSLDSLQPVPCQCIPQLFANQSDAPAILLVRGVLMRLDAAVERVEDGDQVQQKPLDTPPALFVPVPLDSFAVIFEIGLPADECLQKVFLFRAQPGKFRLHRRFVPSRRGRAIFSLRCRAFFSTCVGARGINTGESLLFAFWFCHFPQLRSCASLKARATNATAVIARSYCMRNGPSTPTVPCDWSWKE